MPRTAVSDREQAFLQDVFSCYWRDELYKESHLMCLDHTTATKPRMGKRVRTAGGIHYFTQAPDSAVTTKNNHGR